MKKQVRTRELSGTSSQLWDKFDLTPEQIRAVPCPTCGAEPGAKCELHSGQARTAPHRDRRLAAEDLLDS